MATLSAGSVVPSAERRTLLWSILMHLVPGFLIVSFYISVGLPIAASINYPPLFGLLLAVVFVLVPTQLGYLLYQGKQGRGYLTLRDVVEYRASIAPHRLAALVLTLTVWSFFVSFALGFVDRWVFSQFFAWVPDWFLLDVSTRGYSRASVIVTLVLSLFVTGILAPVVEELYFHGYLLPRLAYFGHWAPVVSTLLFSLYHLWTPWQVLTRFLYVLPTTYVLWRKRSLAIGIWQHCFGNILGGVLMSLGVLARP